jgi:hypothetical protein
VYIVTEKKIAAARYWSPAFQTEATSSTDWANSPSRTSHTSIFLRGFPHGPQTYTWTAYISKKHSLADTSDGSQTGFCLQVHSRDWTDCLLGRLKRNSWCAGEHCVRTISEARIQIRGPSENCPFVHVILALVYHSRCTSFGQKLWLCFNGFRKKLML